MLLLNDFHYLEIQMLLSQYLDFTLFLEICIGWRGQAALTTVEFGSNHWNQGFSIFSCFRMRGGGTLWEMLQDSGDNRSDGHRNSMETYSWMIPPEIQTFRWQFQSIPPARGKWTSCQNCLWHEGESINHMDNTVAFALCNLVVVNGTKEGITARVSVRKVVSSQHESSWRNTICCALFELDDLNLIICQLSIKHDHLCGSSV